MKVRFNKLEQYFLKNNRKYLLDLSDKKDESSSSSSFSSDQPKNWVDEEIDQIQNTEPKD